jgi:8-oxo-dGTP pyrophosphatase MutT (NUDIX family)
MPLRTATSAGAIILREIEGELRIGLAHHDRPGKTWVLPKGHVEAGETLEQAALREIYEETGLTRVQLLMHLGSLMRESIKKNGDIEQKTIHFYLAYALEDGQQTPPPEAGFTHIGWFAPADAVALLPYEGEQAFVREQLPHFFQAQAQ